MNNVNKRLLAFRCISLIFFLCSYAAFGFDNSTAIKIELIIVSYSF